MNHGPRLVGGRYEIVAVIGRGGTAVVHRARDHALHRDVALKVLREDRGDRSGPGVEGTDPGRQRLAHEARLLSRLAHPSVVTLHDHGTDGDRPWLALELVVGRPLSRVLRDGSVRPGPLAALVAQVAAGLAHVHARGVVHRDVKPSNVLVTTAGTAHLTDFGIARLLGSGSELTESGHVVGTAAYIAPEQVRGEQVTGAADVYALGLLLLEALSGQRSFGGPPLEAALSRLRCGPPIPDSLSPAWADLLGAMTAVKPGERPGARWVAQRLHDLATDEGTRPADRPD